MKTRYLLAVAYLVLLISARPDALAESPGSWSRFHGVDGLGDAGGATIPSEWTDSDYAWRRKLGSRDVGSPIFIEGKIYYLVSKPESRKISLESLDEQTGKLRWSKDYDQNAYHLHQRNTFASSTPSADADNVFISWADSNHTYLKCLDHDGNEVWSRDFGSWQSQHGFGTSPRIYGSMVLLMNSQQADQLKQGQSPGKSRMIAVDRHSGETIWETPLVATKSCYGIPAIHGEGDAAQIIDANTGNGMFGMDPKTGKILWSLKVFEMRVCGTPVIAGDVAVGSSGSGGGGNHLVAVRIPKSKDEQPSQIYRIDRGAPYVPTPVVRGDRMYLASDDGFASCIEVQTGKQIWFKRIGGNFGASPVLIGDKLLLISLSGKATILKASDDFQKLGEFDLGGPVGATPAYSNGRLLLRVGDELRCLGGKAI